MKKFLGILLAAILCLGLLPTAFAESEPETVVFEGFLPCVYSRGAAIPSPKPMPPRKRKLLTLSA